MAMLFLIVVVLLILWVALGCPIGTSRLLWSEFDDEPPGPPIP